MLKLQGKQVYLALWRSENEKKSKNSRRLNKNVNLTEIAIKAVTVGDNLISIPLDLYYILFIKTSINRIYLKHKKVAAICL